MSTEAPVVAPKIDRSPEQCGECHRRGAVESVNAKGGFIEHRTARGIDQNYAWFHPSQLAPADEVVCLGQQRRVRFIRNRKHVVRNRQQQAFSQRGPVAGPERKFGQRPELPGPGLGAILGLRQSALDNLQVPVAVLVPEELVQK